MPKSRKSAESGKTESSIPSTSDQGLEGEAPPSVLDHLLNIFKMWWQHLTMRVTVPKLDMEYIKNNCGLEEKQIISLYKQFRLLIGDNSRAYLTVKDLERHSTLLAGNPMKKYTFRILFWNSTQLNFRQYVGNLSLTLSNCIGSPQLHQIRSKKDIDYFEGAINPTDVAQMQKLLAIFNCIDVKGTESLNSQNLCPLLYDLLRCDSDLSVSSLIPHSMISRMVNTAIVSVHAKFPAVCEKICSGIDERSSVDTVNSLNQEAEKQHFEGHIMLLSKELFIRDQEDLHLDQLMAMRL